MSRKIRRAVIPAAGLGTRFLPASKAIPKEMVTVVDKPAVQYVMEEAARAGLDEVMLVTGRGKDSIEDHFDRSPELETALTARGKHELLSQLRDIDALPLLHTVRQPAPLGLGHAVGMARGWVADEPFAVLLPDDLVGADETLLADMVAAAERHDASVLAVIEVDDEHIGAYGVVATDGEAEPGVLRVTDLVEKPDPAEAPSNLAVIGRYVLRPAVMHALRDVAADGRGEIQLTEALRRTLAHEPVLALRFDGTRYDVGSKEDYLRASVELAAGRDDLGPAFRKFLVDFVNGLDAESHHEA